MDKSPNQIASSTCWKRYQTPTALRKYGKQYFEKFWTGEQIPARATGQSIEDIAMSFGATVFGTGNGPLYFFEDVEQAAACARVLSKDDAITVSAHLCVRRRAAP